jgi:putative restriction endonuclease
MNRTYVRTIPRTDRRRNLFSLLDRARRRRLGLRRAGRPTVSDVVERRDLVERVLGIRRWARGGERAPHKQLLILYALGRLQRTGSSATLYTEAEPDLLRLLGDYGPSTHATTPAYPFHRLQNDGLWIVHTRDGSDAGDSRSKLRALEAVGQFTPDVEQALRDDPGLAALVAHAVLDMEFPESLHADLCQAVGLDLEALEVGAARARAATLRRRDPRFREAVLLAYEYRCAVCG